MENRIIHRRVEKQGHEISWSLVSPPKESAVNLPHTHTQNVFLSSEDFRIAKRGTADESLQAWIQALSFFFYFLNEGGLERRCGESLTPSKAQTATLLETAPSCACFVKQASPKGFSLVKDFESYKTDCQSLLCIRVSTSFIHSFIHPVKGQTVNTLGFVDQGAKQAYYGGTDTIETTNLCLILPTKYKTLFMDTWKMNSM